MHITSHSSGFVGLRCATPRKPLNSALCQKVTEREYNDRKIN